MEDKQTTKAFDLQIESLCCMFVYHVPFSLLYIRNQQAQPSAVYMYLHCM